MPEAVSSALRLVPLFPLPGTVFFPQTTLPLHVFEPRYRAMVRDAAEGTGLIAVVLLRPGWEGDYEGRPPIHDLGTVGRIENLHRLDDGRYDLRLTGLERVRFYELASDEPYRVARAEPRPEIPADENDPTVSEAKIGLLAAHAYLMRELAGGEPGSLVLDDGLSFGVALNAACSTLPVDAEVRQRLLEEGDLLKRHAMASELMQRVLETVLRLKGRGGDGGPAGGVN